MDKLQLAEACFTSGDHLRFNAVAAQTRKRDLLILAAQNDAAAFLMKHPNVWERHEPLKLTEQLATDFVDRGSVFIQVQKQTSIAEQHAATPGA